MKRILYLFLALVMAIGLAACGSQPAETDNDSNKQNDLSVATTDGSTVDYTEEMPNQEIDWEYEQKVDQGLIDKEYGLDLSGYDEHGNWSSGRMWVKKTENSWDAVHTYYGYIDTEGNLVGQWHEVGGIYYMDKDSLDAFEKDETLAQWKKPADFDGDYAVVNCGDCTEVIDLQGNTVVKYTYYSVSSYEPKIFAITSTLQIHVYIPRTDRDNLHILRIDNGEVTDIAVTEDGSDYMPSYVRLRDSTFTYWFYNSILEESEFCTFDLDGNLLVQGTTKYKVVNVYPANDGSKTAVLIFVGADTNEWYVEVDAEGNWLSEPARY